MTGKADEQIDLRSSEFRELLAMLPRWPVRWGSVIVLIFLILLFLLSWILKSPELIRTRITFTVQKVAVTIPASTLGVMTGLQFEDSAVFIVDPPGPYQLTGRIFLPGAMGKEVKVNQQVNVIGNFPVTNYRTCRGMISKLTFVAHSREDSSYYSVEVKFRDEFLTEFLKSLPSDSVSAGNAVIITGYRPVIARIIKPLFSVLDRRMLTN
jgi:hypothetical protein